MPVGTAAPLRVMQTPGLCKSQPYLGMTCWLTQGLLSHWSLADNLITASLRVNLRIKQEEQRHAFLEKRCKEGNILERGGTQDWGK